LSRIALDFAHRAIVSSGVRADVALPSSLLMKRSRLSAASRRFGLAVLALAALYWVVVPPPRAGLDAARVPRNASPAAAPGNDASIASTRNENTRKSRTRPNVRRVSTRGLREIGLGRLALARDLFAAGEYEDAIEAYRTAVELYPSAQTHAALGGLYFKLAARSLAYGEFRKAVELDPHNADLWIALANAEHLRTAIGRSWYAIKKAREAEPGIRIVQTHAGFYERDESDPNFHTSRGSYTHRRIP
jgi:tetratricopeptide (TPR) repeat protein